METLKLHLTLVLFPVTQAMWLTLTEILRNSYCTQGLLLLFLFFSLDKNYQEPSPNADGPSSQNRVVLLLTKEAETEARNNPVSFHCWHCDCHNWAMEHLCWKSLNKFKSPAHVESWNWFDSFCDWINVQFS